MKTGLMILMVLTLTACKSVGVTVTDQNGTDWDINYRVFGKSELSDVSATVGNVSFNLGASSNDSPTGTDKVIDAFITGKLVAVPQ